MRAPASLIRHVDPWRDAARGARYLGYLAADRLPRLAAMATLHEPLKVCITFQRGREGEGREAVEIELEICGDFDMTCQRCLDSLTVESALQSSVWLVADEAAARALEPSGEAIVSPPGESLDVASVVEDEVLLALPFAPSHPPGMCAAQCADAELEPDRRVLAGSDTHTRGTKGTDNDAAPGSRENSGRNKDTGDDATRNPFAILAVLREGIAEKD